MPGLDDVQQIPNQRLEVSNLSAPDRVQVAGIPAVSVDQLGLVRQHLMGSLHYLNVVQLVVGDGGYGASHHASLKTKAPTASIAASQLLINSPAAKAQPSI